VKLRLSWLILAVVSFAVTGLGLYFVFLRPVLLPEDLRYLDRSFAQVDAAVPALSEWLRHVFWVMGGYMFAMGLLTFYVAVTTFRTRTRGAVFVVAVTGVASVGGMATVNFLIASDFRWPLLLLALLWALAIAFHLLERAPSDEPQLVLVGAPPTIPAGLIIQGRSCQHEPLKRTGAIGS
jgi:hypothetical protein